MLSCVPTLEPSRFRLGRGVRSGLTVAALATAWCAGCAELASSDQEAFANGAPNEEGDSVADDDEGIGVPNPGGSGLPPEVEVVVDFERPAAGRRYVYAANPEGDSVAVIDASTLSIESVEAGDMPRFLETLAGEDQAIVLNVGSSDATVIRTTQAGSSTHTVPVVADSNAIAVASDGRHAIVYFDARLPGGQRSGSFQDISVLTLDASGDESTGMTVGFKPSAVTFRDDGEVAYVTTEAGVSVIDFDEVRSRGAHIAPIVSLREAADPTALDVSITDDGRFALLRREGDALLALVNLESGERHELDLATFFPEGPSASGDPVDAGSEPAPEPLADAGVATDDDVAVDAGAQDGGSRDAGTTDAIDAGALSDAGLAQASDAGTVPFVVAATQLPPQGMPAQVVTDLDLAPGGSFAVAVVRSLGVAYVLDIPGSFTTGSELRSIRVEGELIGSSAITPDGTRVVLFTTADPSYERVTIVPLGDGEITTVELRKAVRSMTIAPDGKTALVIHSRIEGNPEEPGIDPDTRIDRSFGYSVLNLDTGFAKLELTETAIGPFSVVPDGSALFLLFNGVAIGGREINEVQRVGLDDFLVRSIRLGSPPVSIGAIEASRRVFVGQDHSDGRISFIDWQTGSIESVTGFELNSRIRE